MSRPSTEDTTTRIESLNKNIASADKGIVIERYENVCNRLLRELRKQSTQIANLTSQLKKLSKVGNYDDRMSKLDEDVDYLYKLQEEMLGKLDGLTTASTNPDIDLLVDQDNDTIE